MFLRRKNKNYKLDIPPVGEVTVKEFSTSKGIRIIVHRDASITVTTKPGYAKYRVENFVNQHAEWIEKTRKKIAALSPNGTPKPKHCITVFKSMKHTLVFTPTEKNDVQYRIFNGEIDIHYPKNYDICSTEVQEVTLRAVIRALRAEAKWYIPSRVKLIAEKIGLSYSGVRINSARTRWGSCTSRKNINISCFVMTLPPALIDFVIMHELCHTVHFNHGERFHALLNTLCGGNEKELNKQLRTYRIN